jgi:hypothetical protein
MKVDHDIIAFKKWLFGQLTAWILGGPWRGRKEKVGWPSPIVRGPVVAPGSTVGVS